MKKKYKIEHLNILLVGRKGVGKTTLIKYILDLDNNNINNNPSDFQEYTSQTIKYLKLIEVKGVGYDEGPDIICQKIKNYINNLSNSNGQNFNKVIHCIWYCLTDKRVLEEEEKLFKELTEIYKDNTMPIIFVYTKTKDPAIPQGIERELHSKNINNNFIRTMARNMKLVSGRILEAYGKKDLINTTLKNCTKAMESDMLKIMMQEISKSIKNQLIQENRENIKKILDKTKDDFIQNYNGVLNDRDFFEYIINIFTDNLKYFFSTLKKIKNKSRNLIFKSNFIANIYNVYSFYKRIISEKIKLIEIETAKELIDFQATFEKSKGNMKLNNRRNLKEFEESTKIFLKKNFYFISQNYIIYNLIIPSHSHFEKFVLLMGSGIDIIIKNLLNINNNDENCAFIKQKLGKCFKMKLNSFSNNFQNTEINILEQSFNHTSRNPFFNITKFKNNDENLVNPFNDSKSFIFYKNENIKVNSSESLMSTSRKPFYKMNDIKVTEENFFNSFYAKSFDNNKNEIKSINEIKPINENWFIFQKNKFKLLNKDLENKLANFLQNIKYQESSFYSDNSDPSFNYLQEIIKNELIDFFNANIDKYFKELFSDYNKNIIINNFEPEEIELIIKNENIESYYKKEIHKDLLENLKKDDLIKLETISIIVVGKAGVGKSTLINCLLKDNKAEEGIYNVITKHHETYESDKVPFLKMIDTRGYELNTTYNPQAIKEKVLDIQKELKDKKDLNNFIHCIYFCVDNCEIDQSEINTLRDLRNNNDKTPLIVVFTNTLDQEETDNMKNLINEKFPDCPFVPVLARKIEDNEKDLIIMDKYGLDDLLNTTLKCIKSSEANNIYNVIRDKYKLKGDNNIKEIIEKKEKNIINEIVERFINNYNDIKNENNFEQYIYNLIEKIIQGFSFKESITHETGL